MSSSADADADAVAEPAGPPRLSVRTILSESVATFRREWRALVVLAAVIEVPLVLAEVALHVTPSLRGLVEHESLAGFIALLTVYGSLSHHFLAGVLERVVAVDRRGHERPRIRDVLRHLPWHRLVIADLLVTVLILAGLSLFVIPGLVAATWFALTLPLINLEQRRVLDAFARSRQLVRGHSWRVGAIAVGAFLVPELIIGIVAAVTHTGNVAMDALVHAVPAVLVLPIAALPIVVATFDLVDLEDQTRPTSGGISVDV